MAIVPGVWIAVASIASVSAEEPAAASVPPADPAVYGIAVSADDRAHWSFQPVSRPLVPNPTGAGPWSGNPIDAFILKGLKEKGLTPAPPAEKIAWLRRVSFDLVGLPPTPEQVSAFLADETSEARARVVDRLLADPGYGIRWGRRWLDVVRYADTNGYERDGAKPHVWRYRDWVIDSLNADKPFDRFLTEQLAGDELDGANAETMIATTFLRLGTWDDEPADPKVDRYDQLDDVLGTVSATFLGLTLRCARCHNHKFEPLSQIDYSRMLAIFEPLKRPQQERNDLDVLVGTRQELIDGEAAQSRQKAAVTAIEAQMRALDDRVRARFLDTDSSKLAPEALEAHRLPEDKRNDAQKRLVKETRKQLEEEAAKTRLPDEQKQRDAFQTALTALHAAVPASLPRAYIWSEPAEPPAATQVFRRGNPTTPAGAVSPGFPAVLAAAHVDLLTPGKDARSSLRRLSLARWMTNPMNPLVPRVIVNRLWQGHFGNGLVATENDFGVMGIPPTHPELLDWLAAELVAPTAPLGDARTPPLRKGGEEGAFESATGAESTGNATPPAPPFQRGGAAAPWSLKHIHRLIVLSQTYGQSSRWQEEPSKVDVENSLLWRFPFRRLDAEALRDTVLAVNGQLNFERGGPGVFPKIAREVLEGQSKPGDGWGSYDERQGARRAIYIFVKRSLLVPEMEVLDFADTTTSCEQRPVSTIPTQALTLLNGDFFNQQAAHFATRLVKEAGEDRAAQIARAYQLALARAPTVDESRAALDFLDRQTAQVAEENKGDGAQMRDPSRTALEALCLVLYNLNEFAYAD